MKRKVVKLGPSTLVVSLPSKWIKEQNIAAGDEVSLEVADTKILVSSPQEARTKHIKVAIQDETSTSIRVIITNLYRLGYERILVQHKDQLTILRTVVRKHLLGFEITKETDTNCVIESLTEPSQIKVQQIIGRQFFIIKDMLTCLAEKNVEKVRYYADEIKRYDNFSKRAVNKNLTLLDNKTLLYTFLTLLTHSSRYLLFMSKLVRKELDFTKESEMVDHLRLLYQTKKTNYFYEIHKTQRTNQKKFDSLSRLSKIDAYRYFFSRTIYLASSALLDPSIGSHSRVSFAAQIEP